MGAIALHDVTLGLHVGVVIERDAVDVHVAAGGVAAAGAVATDGDDDDVTCDPRSGRAVVDLAALRQRLGGDRALGRVVGIHRVA